MRFCAHARVRAGGAGEWWTTPDGKSKRYLHSPSTLTALLEAAGFRNVEVQVHSGLLLFMCHLLGRAFLPVRYQAFSTFVR